MQNNNESDIILAIVSILLGLQNLQENREQSAHNDVQAANDKQAKYLLEEISQKFDEQNKILAEQNIMLDKIIKLLELRM